MLLYGSAGQPGEAGISPVSKYYRFDHTALVSQNSFRASFHDRRGVQPQTTDLTASGALVATGYRGNKLALILVVSNVLRAHGSRVVGSASAVSNPLFVGLASRRGTVRRFLGGGPCPERRPDTPHGRAPFTTCAMPESPKDIKPSRLSIESGRHRWRERHGTSPPCFKPAITSAPDIRARLQASRKPRLACSRARQSLPFMTTRFQ